MTRAYRYQAGGNLSTSRADLILALWCCSGRLARVGTGRARLFRPATRGRRLRCNHRAWHHYVAASALRSSRRAADNLGAPRWSVPAWGVASILTLPLPRRRQQFEHLGVCGQRCQRRNGKGSTAMLGWQVPRSHRLTSTRGGLTQRKAFWETPYCIWQRALPRMPSCCTCTIVSLFG
jgi:hypothetical protein